MTFVAKVPIPGTGGYFNFGDIMVMTTALLFGWRVGAFAGGVGSALADLIGGYTQFAPVTFVVKGVEGFLVGLLRESPFTGNSRRNVVALIVGGVVIVTGYFLAEYYLPLFGGPAGALEELPFNLLQAGAGIILSPFIAKKVAKSAPELLLEDEVP